MAFLYISKKHKDGVLKNIDHHNYFGLGNSDLDRIDLYTFAVALGYHRGLHTDLEGGKESFIREENVMRNNIRHAFTAIYFADHESKAKENVETIVDSNITFPLSDSYANAGFSIIQDYMSQYDNHGLCMKLLSEIDKMNEEYQSNRSL